MLNRARFFRALAPTPLPRPRTASQVKTLDAILDYAESHDISDLRWIAYVMGTAVREVGQQLAPVREGFSKSDAAARAYITRHNYKYKKIINGQMYYGRGLVQVTWDFNYIALTKLAQEQGHADVDFYNNPDLLLEPAWAVWAMWEGMVRGIFTGKRLATYFTPTSSDWFNARRIVNGVDDALEIASTAKQFYADLNEAQEGAA